MKKTIKIIKWIILVILSLNFLVSSAFFLLFWRAYNGPRPFEDIITEETVDRITMHFSFCTTYSDEIPIDLQKSTALIKKLQNMELSLPRMDFTMVVGGTDYWLTIYLKNGDKHTIRFNGTNTRGHLFGGKLIYAKPYDYVSIDGGKEYLMAESSFYDIVGDLLSYQEQYLASLENSTE